MVGGIRSRREDASWGPFFDPNMVGSAMVLLLCLLIPLMTGNRFRRNLWPVLFSLLALIALYGSGSRGSALTLMVVVTGYLLMFLGRTHWLLRLPLLLVLVVGVFVSIVLGSEYLDSLGSAGDVYATRGAVLARSVGSVNRAVFMESTRITSSIAMVSSIDFRVLLLGVGEGSGWRSSHNAYLITVYECGLWGLLGQ